MTNLKANDVVVMKSGSPMMVLIEVSKGPQKRARCAYWSKTENKPIEETIYMSALETPEACLDRQTKLKNYMSEDEISTQKSLLMEFSTEAEMQSFVNKMFNGPSDEEESDPFN